jgi:hypothetical protein
MGKVFFGQNTPKHKGNKSENRQIRLHQPIFTAKEVLINVIKQLTNWEKMFTNYISNKRLILEYTRSSKNLIT